MPSFTKKHYEAVAKILRRHGSNTHNLTDAFVDLFKEDNPLFERDKFYAAVYGLPVHSSD